MFSIFNLTLHVVDFLLWNTILSLTLFKIIMVSRPKFWTFLFVEYHSLNQNKKPHCPSPDHRSHIGKKIFNNFFSASQSWFIWKSSLKLNTLLQNSVQQEYLTELYPLYFPCYQKCSLLWCCFIVPTKCGLSPLPTNF